MIVLYINPFIKVRFQHVELISIGIAVMYYDVPLPQIFNGETYVFEHIPILVHVSQKKPHDFYVALH